MIIISRFSPSPTGIIHFGNINSYLSIYFNSFIKNNLIFIRVDDTDYNRYNLYYVKNLIFSINYIDKIYKNLFIFQSNKFYRYLEITQFILNNKKVFISFENIFINKFYKIRNYLNFNKIIFKKKFNKDFNFNKSFSIKIFKFKINLNFFINNFLIIKSNGISVYNYSSVIDDIDLNINLIFRGIDHLNNIIFQLLIFLILKKKFCSIIHLPILLEKKGNKISKKNNKLNFLIIKNIFFLESILIFFIINNNIYNFKKFSFKNTILNIKNKINFYLKINYSNLVYINKRNVGIMNIIYIKNILNSYITKKFFINKKIFYKDLSIIYFFKNFFNKIIDSKFIYYFFKNNFINLKLILCKKSKFRDFYLFLFNKISKINYKKKFIFIFTKLNLINRIEFPFFLKFLKKIKKKLIINKFKISFINIKYIIKYK